MKIIKTTNDLKKIRDDALELAKKLGGDYHIRRVLLDLATAAYNANNAIEREHQGKIFELELDEDLTAF